MAWDHVQTVSCAVMQDDAVLGSFTLGASGRTAAGALFVNVSPPVTLQAQFQAREVVLRFDAFDAAAQSLGISGSVLYLPRAHDDGEARVRSGTAADEVGAVSQAPLLAAARAA